MSAEVEARIKEPLPPEIATSTALSISRPSTKLAKHAQHALDSRARLGPVGQVSRLSLVLEEVVKLQGPALSLDQNVIAVDHRVHCRRSLIREVLAGKARLIELRENRASRLPVAGTPVPSEAMTRERVLAVREKNLGHGFWQVAQRDGHVYPQTAQIPRRILARFCFAQGRNEH